MYPSHATQLTNNSPSQKSRHVSLHSSCVGTRLRTESVRALLVDLTGNERASAVVPFQHGQITEHLAGKDHRLPPAYAPATSDGLDRISAKATIAARRKAKLDASEIVGIGVDFTSATRCCRRTREARHCA